MAAVGIPAVVGILVEAVAGILVVVGTLVAAVVFHPADVVAECH